jgi:hypothetical protein
MKNTRHFSQILKKREVSEQILEKNSNIEFRDNPSVGSRVVPCGRTEGQIDVPT